MAPTMSSRIAVRRIGFLTALTLLLVSSAQAVNYEAHRRDEVPTKHVILTTRDFLEELNFVVPKASYTLQEATEHLLQFSALLRMRIVDTFGNLLYVHYDYFSVTEVEALREVHREMLEQRYDLFDIIPNVLKSQDTRPSRICAEIYDHATESCLRSSVSMCRGIRKQYDLPDHRDLPALNVTYQIYRKSKIPQRYPKGFSLATVLKYLQQEALTITPDLLSGLLYNARYDKYDDDVRLAKEELIRHFRGIAGISEIPTATAKELRKFHDINAFLKHYLNVYAKKFLKHDLRKHAILIAKRISDDIGTIDENIHLLGNVYENKKIQFGYLFDLVLPDDLIENDVIEAKKYLVEKLNKFNVVEKYLKIEKYQQVTPAQLVMEITGQLRDINFAKHIATSLRMHAKFWRSSHMIENLNELLELFDTYENLRQVPHYLRMMRKIDTIKEGLRNMKDISVEILCNAPRACMRMGLRLILQCKFLSSAIKNAIKDFLMLSDVCVDPVYMIQESRRSVEIPLMIEKIRYNKLYRSSTNIGEITTPRGPKERKKTTENFEPTEFIETTESTETASIKTTEIPEIPVTDSVEIIKSTTDFTYEITPEPKKPFHRQKTTAPTSDTTATTSATYTPSDTTITALPTKTTKLPTTIFTTPTSPTTATTELPTTTTTELSTTTVTTSPTTTDATSTITTDIPIQNTVNVRIPLRSSTFGKMMYHVPPAEWYTEFSTSPTTPCDSTECNTEKQITQTTNLFSTMPTITTTHIIIQTTPRPTTDSDVDRFIISSTTELNKPPITSVCLKSCLEACQNSGIVVRTGNSCDISCDSVTEDCDEEKVLKCKTERGKENKTECTTPCSAETPETYETTCEDSQDDDCTRSIVPTGDLKLGHRKTYGILCEIRDPHHRRQLKRLAKMRSMSAASGTVVTSHVLRSTSHDRDQVATKELYNLSVSGSSDFKNKKMTDSVKISLGGKPSGAKDRRRRKERKQIYGQARKRPASKFRGKLIRETTIHRTRGVPFHHSQTKRIFQKRARLISAQNERRD